MAKFTQEHRTLELFTPLGKDVLLFQTLVGTEAISELYQFDIDAFAYNDNLPKFADIIGQPVAVEGRLADGDSRWFHGIVKSFTCLDHQETHAQYRLEVVPKFWLLTNVSRSRIFQQISIPDILKKVLESLDVVFELTGTYEQRDYCVQYRETDFEFASRLMEEEGIFYFFRHYEDRHELVVSDSSQSHEELPYSPALHFDTMRGHTDVVERIHQWEKSQHLRTGKVTLWDHSFEKPGSNFEAQTEVRETLPIGAEEHKLRVGGASELEFYEYPGGYAQRFDGINPGGGERPEEIQKINDDNQRTAEIRANQEAMRMITITAHTHYMNICPGYKFDLKRHPCDDDTYVITKANYSIAQPESYRTSGGEDEVPAPEIVFNCIPFELPFAPPRVTARPLIHGTQVAVVTGPSGEEIFTDKYGRVKVQFFWDREGKHNDQSSCWIRVGTMWAGNNWGMVHIPRIGQEVVVAFEEGDPDQPMIIGSVYNAHEMPPHALPDNKTWSGIKSRSTPKAGAQNLNEIRFEDKIGNEYIFMHAEKDMHFRCKNSYFADIGADFNETIGGNSATKIAGKKGETVAGNYAVVAESNYILAIGAEGRVIAANTMLVAGDSGLKLTGGPDIHMEANSSIKVMSGGMIEINAASGICLKAGGSFVTLNSSGVYISGPMVYINSGGSAFSAASVKSPKQDPPIKPAAALKPEETKPTENPADKAAAEANSHDPKSEENKDKTHWIEVELKDESGAPVVGETCEITLPNGKKATKSTNKEGLIRIDKIDAGNCKIRWIHLDQDAVSQ
jgi:type VI secretion system secreted protein VgrG